MQLDFVFIAKMLSKHASHLTAQQKFMQENLETYERQIDLMQRNDPVKYRTEIQRMEFKKSEVLEKLSHVEPNLKKINEQIAIMENGESMCRHLSKDCAICKNN